MNIPNVTHTDTDRLITTRELAEMLKVSQNAIDRDRMIGGGVYRLTTTFVCIITDGASLQIRITVLTITFMEIILLGVWLKG